MPHGGKTGSQARTTHRRRPIALKAKTAIITGSNSGIGLGITEARAKAGAILVAMHEMSERHDPTA